MFLKQFAETIHSFKHCFEVVHYKYTLVNEKNGEIPPGSEKWETAIFRSTDGQRCGFELDVELNVIN